MSINTGTVGISAEDGKSMDLYVAAPDGGGKKPALLVIMEIFGVNAHMKDVTERFANEGYVAISPDLYYRLDERVIPSTDRDAAFAARGTLYDTKIIDDLNRAIAYAKGRDDVDPDRGGDHRLLLRRQGVVDGRVQLPGPGGQQPVLRRPDRRRPARREEPGGARDPREQHQHPDAVRVGAGRTRASRRKLLDTIEATLKANNVDYSNGTSTRTPATRFSATTGRATTRPRPRTSGPRAWLSWAGT